MCVWWYFCAVLLSLHIFICVSTFWFSFVTFIARIKRYYAILFDECNANKNHLKIFFNFERAAKNFAFLLLPRAFYLLLAPFFVSRFFYVSFFLGLCVVLLAYTQCFAIFSFSFLLPFRLFVLLSSSSFFVRHNICISIIRNRKCELVWIRVTMMFVFFLFLLYCFLWGISLFSSFVSSFLSSFC